MWFYEYGNLERKKARKLIIRFGFKRLLKHFLIKIIELTRSSVLKYKIYDNSNHQAVVAVWFHRMISVNITNDSNCFVSRDLL